MRNQRTGNDGNPAKPAVYPASPAKQRGSTKKKTYKKQAAEKEESEQCIFESDHHLYFIAEYTENGFAYG